MKYAEIATNEIRRCENLDKMHESCLFIYKWYVLDFLRRQLRYSIRENLFQKNGSHKSVSLPRYLMIASKKWWKVIYGGER